jgi:hypothetical protein
MKTPEDEAWEEMERQQGAGGFPAKRKMAADKLHWSDCAVHNAPAYPAGACDCGVAQEPEREALKLALDALESDHPDIQLRAQITLRAVLAQPVQEPEMLTIAYQSGYHDGKKAAQRPWVGLTDDELADIWYKESLDWMEFARAHEAALKEKNSG